MTKRGSFDQIEETRDRVLVELLQKMIQIPSWVPDDEDGKRIQNENKLVDFIEIWLKANTNLMVTRQKLNYGRFNLIAAKGRPNIIFLAHTDTVAPSTNSRYSSLGGEIHEGKIWGRGSADMKSGIAALMQAAALSPEADNYAIFFYADEEYDFLGMKALVRDYADLRPKFIISADGADLRMGNGCRGLIEIRARVIGEAAHAATGKGKNAVLGVYKTVEELGKYFEEKSDPMMGRSSLNLAYVMGGKEMGEEGIKDNKLVRVGQEGNVVPDVAEFVIDIRPSSPEISVESIIANMEKTACDLGVKLEVVNVRHNLRAWFTERNEIEKFEKLASDVCGTAEIKSSDSAKGGYLDVQMLWEALEKPPSLVFGAGSATTEHTDNEYVEIENLITTRNFFVKTLENQA